MSQSFTQKERVLALSLRARRFGYAMFEGTKLLDYGVCSCGSGTEVTAIVAAKRIDGLLRLLRPTRIVIRQQSRSLDRSLSASQSLLQSVTRAARAHGIDIHRITAAEVRTAFAPFNVKTKYQATAVVVRFVPELLPKLPPPRKTWQAEQEITMLFEAVAVGIVDIEKCRGQLLPFL
jgi:hypothetical protein